MDKAALKVTCEEFGAATFKLVCPVQGDYKVTVTSDECLDREFERFDDHRTLDAKVTIEYEQQALHFYAALAGEQSLRIKVKDSTQEDDYEAMLMSPRSGDEEDWEEVIRVENVEVEYIPFDSDESSRE